MLKLCYESQSYPNQRGGGGGIGNEIAWVEAEKEVKMFEHVLQSSDIGLRRFFIIKPASIRPCCALALNHFW